MARQQRDKRARIRVLVLGERNPKGEGNAWMRGGPDLQLDFVSGTEVRETPLSQRATRAYDYWVLDSRTLAAAYNSPKKEQGTPPAGQTTADAGTPCAAPVAPQPVQPQPYDPLRPERDTPGIYSWFRALLRWRAVGLIRCSAADDASRLLCTDLSRWLFLYDSHLDPAKWNDNEDDGEHSLGPTLREEERNPVLWVGRNADPVLVQALEAGCPRSQELSLPVWRWYSEGYAWRS